MTTPIQIRLAYKRGRYWFRIGSVLVRTYPQARRLMAIEPAAPAKAAA